MRKGWRGIVGVTHGVLTCFTWPNSRTLSLSHRPITALAQIICFPWGEWQLHWLIVNDKQALSPPRVRGWLPAECLPDREMNKQRRQIEMSISASPCRPVPWPGATPRHYTSTDEAGWGGGSETASWEFAELLSSPKWCLERLEEKMRGNSGPSPCQVGDIQRHLRRVHATLSSSMRSAFNSSNR